MTTTMEVTQAETCDRCGVFVTASLAVLLPSGRVLTFCGHHYREHQEALAAA